MRSWFFAKFNSGEIQRESGRFKALGSIYFFFEAQFCCQVLKIAIYYVMAFFRVTFIRWSVGALKQAFVNDYFPMIINFYVI